MNRKYSILKDLAIYILEIIISFIYAKNNYVDLMPMVYNYEPFIDPIIFKFINFNIIIWSFVLVILSFVLDRIFKNKNKKFKYFIQLIILIIIGLAIYIKFVERVY